MQILKFFFFLFTIFLFLQGNLGMSNNTDQAIPCLLVREPQIKQICCAKEHSIIMKKNGEVFVFGGNRNGEFSISFNFCCSNSYS